MECKQIQQENQFEYSLQSSNINKETHSAKTNDNNNSSKNFSN